MCTDAVYESQELRKRRILQCCWIVGISGSRRSADSPLSIVASGQSDELRRFQLNDSVVVTAVFHADGMQVGSDDAPGEAVQLVRCKVGRKSNRSTCDKTRTIEANSAQS